MTHEEAEKMAATWRLNEERNKRIAEENRLAEAIRNRLNSDNGK